MTLFDALPILAMASAYFTIAFLLSRLFELVESWPGRLIWKDRLAVGGSAFTIALIGLSLLSLK